MGDPNILKRYRLKDVATGLYMKLTDWGAIEFTTIASEASIYEDISEFKDIFKKSFEFGNELFQYLKDISSDGIIFEEFYILEGGWYGS